LASCIDDETKSVRMIHKLHGLLAMFDQPIIAQLAADAERSRQVADARRLLHAVDDLLSTLCEEGD
jgi:HPt (histidine-containing phosphotransfer) domain-containing protein